MRFDFFHTWRTTRHNRKMLLRIVGQLKSVLPNADYLLSAAIYTREFNKKRANLTRTYRHLPYVYGEDNRRAIGPFTYSEKWANGEVGVLRLREVPPVLVNLRNWKIAGPIVPEMQDAILTFFPRWFTLIDDLKDCAKQSKADKRAAELHLAADVVNRLKAGMEKFETTDFLLDIVREKPFDGWVSPPNLSHNR